MVLRFENHPAADDTHSRVLDSAVSMAASADDLRPPPSSARISSDTVRRAVESLMKWKADKSRTENPQLLADEEYVYLNLTLKKIPPKARVNPHKLPLPNPLHSQATGTELCLILDDREKSKLTKAEAKKKVEADDIGVGKILKLSKLKTDYRAYEAKRKLCASYDMFLVDKRLIPLMPKLLGKQFYKKKKIPVPIDLTHRNWKEQISRAIGSALLYLNTGTCSVVKVARVAMEVEEIVDNVISAINGIVEILPKKWDSVRSFHLKLSGSLSLPIYQALPDLKLKISGVEKNVEEKVDEGEVTDDAKKDENVMKKSAKKGRIHDVRYMDTETNDLPDESDLVTEDHSGDENVLDDADNIDSEDAADVDASPLKKRKKASSKLDKAAGKKRVKKDASSKKKDSMKTRSEVQEVIAEKKLKKVAKSEKTEGAKLKDKKRNKITK